ncbi:MAG: RibD family protein, partial [Stackebrandtia sp.]
MTNERPFVLLSAAVSVDGYLDDASGTRLVLSNEDDMARVRELRGDFDAILVGAATIRRDNPSLAAAGKAQPRKVTVTGSGELDPGSRFFAAETPPLVFCGEVAADGLRRRLADRAEVHDFAAGGGPAELLATLWRLGVRRLMVEGGTTVHTQFLQEGLADALRLAVAPFFVGQAAAPRFTRPGDFHHDGRHRMRLNEVERIGDMAVLH